MKIISSIETPCVLGGNSMERQTCLQTEPWGFIQWGNGADDKVKQTAEKPWDPPLEQSMPSRFDIVFGLIGLGAMVFERFRSNDRN
jgi:hypothetical protein